MKALLVLGGYIEPVNRISKELKARLDVAFKLWNSGRYDVIVLSGGICRPETNQTESEAYLMAEYLKNCGLQEDIMILEDKSLNTYDNVFNSIEILQEKFGDDFEIKIVSHFLHSVRATIMAKSKGVKAEATAKIEQWHPKHILSQLVRVIYTYVVDSTGDSGLAQKLRSKRIQ